WIREELRTQNAERRATWIWTPRVYPTRLHEHRFPTRQELDLAAPDHPVAVDGAYAFVLNTAALQAAGITRQSTDPPGGAIVKDAAGGAAGVLQNGGGGGGGVRAARDAVALSRPAGKRRARHAGARTPPVHGLRDHEHHRTRGHARRLQDLR